ncbi:MAG: hypothetical protein PVG99_16085 [Desulfobacteraceae bacterium]
MTKKRLVEIILDLLKTDIDLSFLVKLKQKELEQLIACIRERVDFLGG